MLSRQESPRTICKDPLFALRGLFRRVDWDSHNNRTHRAVVARKLVRLTPITIRHHESGLPPLPVTIGEIRFESWGRVLAPGLELAVVQPKLRWIVVVRVDIDASGLGLGVKPMLHVALHVQSITMLEGDGVIVVPGGSGVEFKVIGSHHKVDVAWNKSTSLGNLVRAGHIPAVVQAHACVGETAGTGEWIPIVINASHVTTNGFVEEVKDNRGGSNLQVGVTIELRLPGMHCAAVNMVEDLVADSKLCGNGILDSH